MDNYLDLYVRVGELDQRLRDLELVHRAVKAKMAMYVATAAANSAIDAVNAHYDRKAIGR